MRWLIDNWPTVLSVVAFLVAGFKAWRRGQLANFLAIKMEGLASQNDKEELKVSAVAVGLQSVLDRTVVNAGLSSKKRPAKGVKKIAQVLVPLVLAAVLLPGCGSSVDPYRLAVKGMAETGDDVRPLVKTPLTPGEQALVDAWDFQRSAGHKLVDGK